MASIAAGPPPDPIYVFHGFSNVVSAVHFVTINGKHLLLVGDMSGECSLWDLNTMKSVWKQAHINEDYQTSSVQPSILSCGSWSRGIWAHTRGRCVRFWREENEKNGPILVSQKGTLPCPFIGFCSASVSAVATSYDLVAIPVEHDATYSIEVYKMTMDDKLERFAVANFGRDSDSMSTGAPMACVLADAQCFNSKSFDPDRQFLIVGFESGTIQIWHITENTIRPVVMEKMAQETILHLDYLPSRSFGVCVSPEKVIHCWRITSNDAGDVQITNRSDISIPSAGTNVVSIRMDGKIFATGGWDGKVRVFSVKKLTPLAVLQVHTASIKCLTFSHVKVNGMRLMAVGSQDGSLSLWNLYSS